MDLNLLSDSLSWNDRLSYMGVGALMGMIVVFAVLALLPIWLYNGEQGPYNKTIRRLCYAFYPAHILALVMIGWIASFCLN